MKNKYKVIVFDWESTLAEDFAGHIVYIIVHKAVSLGITIANPQALREELGAGLAVIVAKVFNKFNLTQQDQILGEITKSLTKPLSFICLMPGAFDLVKQLHNNGIGLAIATNKGCISLKKALDLSGLEKYFYTTCSADQFSPKPCVDMLLEIMRIFNVKAHETLMIGDSIADLQMAYSAGVDAIGLDAYHKNTFELQSVGALQVFDNFGQLRDFLT